MIRNFLSLSFAAALIAALTSANLGEGTSTLLVDWRIAPEPVLEVRAEAPSRGPVVRKVLAHGVVEPIEEAKVGPLMSGRVVAVYVKEGDEVKPGDVLVRLDDSDPRSRLRSAQAKTDRLRAAITQAEIELARASREESQHGRLAGRGVSSVKDLADAKSVVATAEAALEMSRQELEESQALWRLAQEELNRTEIRSPIAGAVTRLEITVGEVVIAGTANLPGSVLMTVSDLSEMRVKAEVDESDVPLVRAGQPARVFLQSNNRAPISAVVDKVAAKGRKADDSVSFVTRLKVTDLDAPLRAEMTATVEIDVKRVPDALGLPIQAVVQRRRRDLPDAAAFRGEDATDPQGEWDDGAGYVKVVFVVEGGVAKARPVETGISDNRRVEIVSGLGPADRVVVGPFRALDELKDGTALKVADAEKATPGRAVP